jgi:hypothetical protein
VLTSCLTDHSYQIEEEDHGSNDDREDPDGGAERRAKGRVMRPWRPHQLTYVSGMRVHAVVPSLAEAHEVCEKGDSEANQDETAEHEVDMAHPTRHRHSLPRWAHFPRPYSAIATLVALGEVNRCTCQRHRLVRVTETPAPANSASIP